MKNIFIIVTLGCVVFGDTSEVKSVSVMEGDSVTLHINVTDIQQNDQVHWRFALGGDEPNRLIAEIEEKKINYESVEGFIGRLDLNILTGDLTIKNMRIKHSGPYKAVIVRGGETPVMFRVTVKESPHDVTAGTDEETVLKTKGDSVTLDTGVQTQRGDLILWRFGDDGDLIAKHDKEDNKSPIYYDGGSKDRLQVNNQNGSLTISDVRPSDSGLYKLKISSNSKQTLYKRFIVSVSDVSVIEQGLSGGSIAAIVVGVLLAIAGVVVAVMWSRRRESELKKRMAANVSVSVLQGEDVTLPPDLKDMPTADEGEWIYADKETIARFNKKKNTFSTYNVLDERFKGKLKLNSQTGSLTIKYIKTSHSGLYKLKISSSTGPSYIHYNVTVMARDKTVRLRGSVTLETGVTDIKTDDEILWTVGPENTRIVRITGGIDEPSPYYYPDERFRDRVKMNNQTGDLTITYILKEHIGVFEVLTYINGETRCKKFTINTVGSAIFRKKTSPKDKTPLLNDTNPAVRPAV